MSAKYELEKVQSKITALENKIEEIKKRETHRNYKYVVVKKLKEVIPDLKAFEAMMIMNEQDFVFELRTMDPIHNINCIWNTDIAGKSFEISQEHENFYTVIKTGVIYYIKKEHVKRIEEKTEYFSYSFKAEQRELEKLRLQIPELEKKAELERIEEEKEAKLERIKEEKFFNDFYIIKKELDECEYDIHEKIKYEEYMIKKYQDFYKMKNKYGL